MKERVIALGFFDGVHLGHGALLRRAAEEAALRGCTPAVFTFDRPPKEVVTGVPCPLINSPEDRRDLVRRLYRIQDVLMVPFDREMMTTPWDDFIVRILVGRYHAVHLVAGHDHHFGHRNQGTPELLAQKCAQLGLGCDIIPKVEVDQFSIVLIRHIHGTPPRSKKFSFLISPSFSWIIRRHLHNFFDAPYNAPGPFSWKEAYPCFIPKS